MPRKKQTRGTCLFCGREFARGGMGRHLQSCPERQALIEKGDQGAGKAESLYHLQVQDAWGGDFWLHLEVRGQATLKDIDRYLRAIWLECCGHLSRFSLGKRAWDGPELAKSRRVDSLFAPGTEVMHIYDFGTSSETLLIGVAHREGRPLSKHPIYLMARNDQPEEPCMVCGTPATYLCIECVYEDETSGLLCDEHVEDHPHENYGEPVPFVNSPRVGMCGYEGPADPPY